MSDFREQFIALCERIDAEAGDGFAVARVAQVLDMSHEHVDSILLCTFAEDTLTPKEQDVILLRLCTVVAEYEANKARYKTFKKGYKSGLRTRSLHRL